ncbi:MAG: four-helix bundle copper-binding protein [Bdellovibrionaceae bacterium]|nr:four-helix bundle copper-binding protein [Pseudobdellovibrionaceae bacterium]MBX3035064.1 four-helix bundle copper-binding protein [Pseudobdellovibrionaceae bacterium]
MVIQPNVSLGSTGKIFKNLPEEAQECIRNCLACHQICEQLMFHSLEKKGEHADADHIRLLHDCAEICAITANFLMRDSTFHHRACEVCAEICRACAEDCEDFEEEDEALETCAAACRTCAQSCERMSSQH